MWITIEVVDHGEKVVFLPEIMMRKFQRKVKVFFGRNKSSVKLISERELELVEENSFDNPQRIRISSKLAEVLNLPERLIYQMKYDRFSITIGPVIGLLLGGHNYLYSPSHMEKYSDRFGIYNKIGGLIYAFSYKSIDWKEEVVYGLYYNNVDKKWCYGKFPLPKVIYRRDFHTDPKMERRLDSVCNGKMFNSWRFTKYFFYKHVRRDKELKKHLPATKLSRNYEQVKMFIDNNKSIILKPTHLSRGRGICIISKEVGHYKVMDYRNRIVEEKKLQDDEALKAFFEDNKEFFDKYLMQKLLLLAKVDGAPFDIRVVMQKEAPKQWKCTGIECRVAGKETLVTNISRGGYALTLDKALLSAFPQSAEEQDSIKKRVYSLCRKICRSLEKTGHHFAELGMDIAVDEQGFLWIIEVNVFPSFKGFKTMDYDTYLDIRHTPMLYAAHLAGFNQTE
jgi:glutathione synthase/RimK-type ligase-like ATP-grasp enzyme